MPVPKRKRSRSRNRIAHANKHLEAKAFNLCNNCKAPIQPHVACNNCGFYKGVKIFETKMDRVLKRGIARKAQQAAQEPQTATTEA